MVTLKKASESIDVATTCGSCQNFRLKS